MPSQVPYSLMNKWFIDRTVPFKLNELFIFSNSSNKMYLFYFNFQQKVQTLVLPYKTVNIILGRKSTMHLKRRRR